MKDIWKPVVGFEGKYEVSNLGRVRSIDHEVSCVRDGIHMKYVRKGTILTPQPRRHGYLSVWLYGNGGVSGRSGKQYSVHRIVAEAFLPNPSGCEEVNHINEDKTDNRVCNLEWCTHRENSNRGTRPQRIGVAHTNGKKSKAVSQYTADGVFVCTYSSFHEAGRQGYGITNIWNCAAGKQALAYGYMWKYADCEV